MWILIAQYKLNTEFNELTRLAAYQISSNLIKKFGRKWAHKTLLSRTPVTLNNNQGHANWRAQWCLSSEHDYVSKFKPISNFLLLSFTRHKKSKCTNNPYSPHLNESLQWSPSQSHTHPLQIFRLLYTILLQNDCTSTSFLTTMWPWVKVKVIQTGIKSGAYTCLSSCEVL